MQRTIKVLRVALPIVILAFIALIVVSYRSTVRRDKSAAETVTSTQRPGDAPQAEAKTFEDVQTIGGRVVSRIRAERVVSFKSGWTTLEGVALTMYRENGLTYELSCPQAQFNSDTKEAEAKGGVRVKSSDGIDIATAEIRYDGARLTNEIPVEFTVDRWKGNAGALDFDVQNETLRLFKNVVASMTPATPADAPMTLRGVESVFRRAENTVTFNQQVQMDRGSELVKANFVMGRFTQDRKQLIGLEGNGNVQMVMASAAAPGQQDLGGRKEIFCDAFATEVGPDGQINAIIAHGTTNPAHAVLDGPPKRDIVARSFRVALANRVVSEIKADVQVVMKELGDAPRQVQAEHATVWFDPATRRARAAYLEGAFRYTDPRSMASAFRANYDIAGDRIVLTTDPGWQATVISDGQVLKAKQIEFAPRAQTAHASGSVIAQLVSKGKNNVAADATNLFPSGKPVFVNADDLIMRQAQKVAVFTGNVRAWQDNNTLLANEMQVQGNGEIITARGNVRTVLHNAAAAGEPRTAPVQSTSEQLIAKKGERRVDLLGNVAIKDDTRSLKSQKAALFFDENKKIQRMEAEGGVSVAESATRRKGAGDRAVYQVDKKMIYMYGSPATVSDPSGSVSGQQIVFDLTRNRVQVVSPEGQTKGTYKHEG